MRVLLTGSTGFLGQTIKEAFQGHELITVGRHDCNIIADLSFKISALPSVDAVVHAAGKAHIVPKTQKQKDDFFEVNVWGTHNLLKALEENLPSSFLFISSVAVYGKTEGALINEEAELTAIDPYGRSKIEAENLIKKWCFINNVRLCILRLPLLVGLNPPGNLKLMINGIKKGYYFNIAGGTSRKSMVLTNDIAEIIPKALEIGGVYNLTDGYHPSFAELSEIIAMKLNKRRPVNIPSWLAITLASSGDFLGSKAMINSVKLKKITSELTFDDTKARQFLDWNPALVLKSLPELL